MRHLTFLLFFLLIFPVIGPVAEAAIVEAERTTAPRLDEVDLTSNPTRTRLTDRVLCVDGLKLFQTIGPAWGNGASPVISTIQLYEERGGKVLPVRCPK